MSHRPATPFPASLRRYTSRAGLRWRLQLAFAPLLLLAALPAPSASSAPSAPLPGSPARPVAGAASGVQPAAGPSGVQGPSAARGAAGARVAATATAASGADTQEPGALSSAEFQRLLRHGSLEQLDLACQQVFADDRLDRLRQLRERLLLIHPAPQPLPVVLANAEVLLRCRQPTAALTVLDRISPAAGAERLQWLLLQWRAAQAALDHRRAALALERLTAARPERLEALQLPVLRREDGSVVSRPAIDLLAEHLQGRGFPQAAAQLLLASQDPGTAGAQRRLQALALLQQLPVREREALLEASLDQAAAVGAWGLVAELLDAQAALPSERARQRRLRLSPRIDDAYGEWLMLRQDPAAARRSAELERQLRSPRAPGGHNAAAEDGSKEASDEASPAAPAASPALSPAPAP